jgi:hypothetical protein
LLKLFDENILVVELLLYQYQEVGISIYNYLLKHNEIGYTDVIQNTVTSTKPSTSTDLGNGSELVD